MGQLVVYLPDVAEGALVEVPPYGVFANMTRNDVEELEEDFIVAEDFEGDGWVAPPEDEETPPVRNEDMDGFDVVDNSEGGNL